jgi:membrane protease YdiL (CAAX protease family)
MLFLPLLDRGWRVPALPRSRPHYLAWAGLLLAGAALLAWWPSEIPFALTTLLLAALPEEWFFRAYFMTRLRWEDWRANIAASALFALLHGLTRGWAAALLVFIPSLFYGWLYQRTQDLPLIVLAHALSNLVYALFLAGFVAAWMPDLR